MQFEQSGVKCHQPPPCTPHTHMMHSKMPGTMLPTSFSPSLNTAQLLIVLALRYTRSLQRIHLPVFFPHTRSLSLLTTLSLSLSLQAKPTNPKKLNNRQVPKTRRFAKKQGTCEVGKKDRGQKVKKIDPLDATT
jgi:hypothetical protein